MPSRAIRSSGWRSSSFLTCSPRMPHTPGDFKEKDITLREHEVKVVGNFAVTYWFDAPVKIVMIVNLRPAGS